MAATNSSEFFLGIDQFLDESQERHGEIAKAVALRGLSDVALNTSVDTGRARGNWQVTEGQPATGFDKDLGALEGRDGPDAPSRRADPINTGAGEIERASGRDVIWLHNGVPYIQYIEGRMGMVRGAYESALTWLRSLS